VGQDVVRERVPVCGHAIAAGYRWEASEKG
jgi:hypothetical protein